MGLREFTFAGTASSTYNLFITEAAPYNAPPKAVEMIEIPGRNGAYALDKGNFENVEVTYHVCVYDEDNTDFAAEISDVRNWLCSQVGYQRLEDDYNPNEYRMAIYKSGLETDQQFLNGAEFDITFECKPQRWLTSGEELITIGEWRDVQTAEGAVATFEADSATRIKSLTVDIEPIQDLHGYDAPWVGGAGVNKWDEQWELGGYSTADGEKAAQTNTIRSTNAIQVTPNGSYYIGVFGTGAIYLFYYDQNGDYVGNSGGYVSSGAKTLPNDAYQLRFQLNPAYGTTYNNDIAINYPSTITTYSPYENICPISGRNSVGVVVDGFNLFDENNLLNAVNWTKPDDYYVGTTGKCYAAFKQANGGFWQNTKGYTGQIYVGAFGFFDNANCGFRFRIYYTDGTYTDAVGGAFTTTPAFHGGLSSSGKIVDCITCDYSNDSTLHLKDFCINFSDTNKNGTYESYNGTTYTTSLGTTVYGGTLDVVSGVGSNGYEGFNPTSVASVAYSSSKGLYYVVVSNTLDSKADNTSVLLSNMFKNSDEVAIGKCYFTGLGKYLIVTLPDQTITTKEQADIWFANNNVQFVYEKATADTLSVQGQSIPLLLGTNNIFADSGDVTVEYGHDPNILTNPTLFDARPQLQVYGYGDIDLGGQSVKVNNVSIGSVLIANSQRFNAPEYESLIASVGCDVGMLNNGDDILVSNIKSSIAYQTNTGTFLIDGTGIVINSTTNATANAQLAGPTKYSVTVTADDITFSKGTSASSTATVSQTINYKISGVAYSKSTVFTIVTSYDGNDTISFSASVSNITSSDVLKYLLGVKSNDIYGDSSKSALGNPLYIDLDIGECWNEDSGTPVSINNAVTLPAELPTLPIGNTTITFDNTFTQVDIVPRWWKV